MEPVKLDERQQKILNLLQKSQSMPFLELGSFAKLPNNDVSAAVERLSDLGLVSIVGQPPFEQIITVTSKGLRAEAS